MKKNDHFSTRYKHIACSFVCLFPIFAFCLFSGLISYAYSLCFLLFCIGTEKSSSATCGLTYNNTLTFRNVSSTTVEVSWSNLDIFDVSLGPVSGYAIEYREEGHQYFTRENKYENTTHIFSNLTQDTVYEFRLVLTSCGLPVDILTSEISTTRTLCGGKKAFKLLHKSEITWGYPYTPQEGKFPYCNSLCSKTLSWFYIGIVWSPSLGYIS